MRRDDADDATARDERPYRAGAPSRERLDAPATPGKAPLLTLAGQGQGAAGRRSRDDAPASPSTAARRPVR